MKTLWGRTWLPPPDTLEADFLAHVDRTIGLDEFFRRHTMRANVRSDKDAENSSPENREDLGVFMFLALTFNLGNLVCVAFAFSLYDLVRKWFPAGVQNL